jgi:hypothetical protein
MTPESATKKVEEAKRGYWSEWRKYYRRPRNDRLTVYERRRALLKSAKQWNKAIINRRMAEGGGFTLTANLQKKED